MRSPADMETEDMRKIIESAKVGTTLLVKQAGGRATRYTVRGISGRKARQLALDGSRGVMRVLFDDGEVWIRDAKARASDEKAYRRVMLVQLVKQQAPAPELLRDMAIREAGLPPGYDIELHPRGFQAYSHTDGEPVGEVQASAWVAVCKCWEHHAQLPFVLPPNYTVISSRGGFCYQLPVPGTGTHGQGQILRTAAEAVIDAWRHALDHQRLEHERTDERLILDLPRGYAIEPGDPGFHRAVLDDSGWVGAARTSTSEAVVDALVHAIEQLETTVGRHRTTAIDRDVARADASRCRRALQQIREIANGSERSGKELPSGEMPEQVVSDVGHALRVESKGREDGWKSASRMLLEQPGLTWAAAGMPGLKPSKTG